MEAYIVKAYRTAVGKAGRGFFRNERADDLAAAVIRHLVADTPGLEPGMIDDILVGCANPEGEQGLQTGRQIALMALGKEVPGITVNRYCASGLETIAMAVAKIRSGMGHCFIAGGAESMSLVPMTGYKLAPNYQVARDTPDYVVSMGITAEAVARKYGISRADCDAFSLRSHTLAAAAIDKGHFAEEIVPYEVTEVLFGDGKRQERKFTALQDEGVRRETTLDALGKLKPAFAQGGVATAGNSSQTSDGAAFTLVVSDDMLKTLNLQPIARLAAYAVGGVDPLYMGIGPCVAIPKALRQAGLSLQEIDLIELNEAFAAQALAVIREAGLDPDKVNVNGGAIALGHPLGCTGAKLSASLFREVRRRDKKYGMVTACVGGGQGVAGIYEIF